MDVFTPEKRSEVMSRIRSRGTRPERMLGEALRGLGHAFETHFADLPCRPDFWFPRRGLAVFLDGCFWHGHRKCYRAPKSNAEFWRAKVEGNRRRDRRNRCRLTRSGVSYLVVWECEVLRDLGGVLIRILHVLESLG